MMPLSPTCCLPGHESDGSDVDCVVVVPALLSALHVLTPAIPLP